MILVFLLVNFSNYCHFFVKWSAEFELFFAVDPPGPGYGSEYKGSFDSELGALDV